ncbi:peptidase S8/S53 domain-containing protein, partial [Trichophaea hybrida]
RGFPDVAAQGNNYEFFINGTKELISGTSASCPTFAAIITLVNDYRLRHGKAQLGFLNPLLYKNPNAFTDVVKGKSQGCNGTDIVTDALLQDPVTGLGTPKFDMLLNI